MSRALVPQALPSSSPVARLGSLALAGVLGVVCMSVLARLQIHLPWTPVPITGQTFGVALIALLCGRNLALPTLAAYLAVRLSGSALGGVATAGYLGGMLVAAGVMGYLADRGWSRTFGGALAATFVGSAITYAGGLLVLSRFVPNSLLLGAGLWPFLIGDLIKNILAAALASVASRRVA